MTRSVLVTGAASGNGLAIATRFLAAGDRVAAVDSDADGLARAAQRHWGDYADRLMCLHGDVADEARIDALFHDAERAWGDERPVQVLINNAGITGGPAATRLHETPVAEFDRVWAVNVRAMYLACRRALPGMLSAGGGLIVNIASVAGLVAFPGRAAYTVSKGAAVQLSRSIAADYAGEGIRCNALCPGMIETPMTHWRLAQPGLREQVLQRIPQREIGTAEDVADAVHYLCSPEARYFNGAAVVMDGGWTAV